MPGAFATNFVRHVDRGMVDGLAAMAGVSDLSFDAESRLPQEQLDQIQRAMSTTIGDPTHIARAVEYVVSQPIDLNIEELVIRPGKSLF